MATKYEDILAAIDADEFYQQYLQNPKPHGREVIARCPFHEDHSPSFSYNKDTGKWKCHACNVGGHFTDFLAKAKKIDRADAVEYIREHYGGGNGHVPKPKPVEEPQPERSPLDGSKLPEYQKHLWETPKLIDFLRYQRGLSDEIIAKYEWGADGSRYTLPIRDKDGKLVNIRKYSPKLDPKWLNTRDYGGARLFPLPLAESDTVIICEGELDTLVAIQNGFDAVTATGGAGTWNDDWSPLFKGKIVYLCYDNDDAGKAGAIKAAESLARYASSIRMIQWPMIVPEKGDVSDWFVRLKMDAVAFNKLLQQASEYTSPKTRKYPKDVKGVLPDGGFISAYVGFASELTDAPTEFHLAVAYAILGAACRNKVTFYSWGQDVCMNLWTILIAPSGFYRKSTAMNIGIRLLNKAVSGIMFPDDFSRESFLEILSEQPSGLLPAFEFKSLIDRFGADYMKASTETFTLLYDSPDRYERVTMKGGKKPIIKPSVSILAASTVDWLQSNRRDMEGGFMPRFLLWPAYEKTTWMGLSPPASRIIEDSLVAWLQQISNIEGEVVMTPEVRERYNAWIKQHEEGFNADKLPLILQGFYTRMATCVMKLAVLNELSACQSLEISLQSLQQAIRTMEYLKSHLHRLIQSFSFTKESYTIKSVKSIIESHKIIDYSTWLKYSQLYKTDFERILQTLLQTGDVEAMPPEKTGGRPKRMYKLLSEEST